MHRIDGPGSVSGHFSNGNPFTTPPTNGTSPTAEWCETVQEESAAVIEATGRTLDKADNAQLLAAIRDLIANSQTSRRRVYIGCQTGADALDVSGLSPSPTLLGGVTNTRNTRGAWLEFNTATPGTTPEDIGFAGPFNVLRRGWPVFDFTFRVDLQTVTASRLWVGLFSASPATLTDPATISCVGFRYEAGVDSASWSTCSSNGANSTVKVGAAPVAVLTSYELRVRHVGSGRFEFLVNGALVGVHDNGAGEFVPAGTTELGPVCLLRHLTDASNKVLRFGFFAA